MKKISTVAASIALSLGMASAAQAVTLVSGGLKFTFNAYDNGTVGYGAFTSNMGHICNDYASCDAEAAFPSSGSAPYNEDSWGVFSIATITKTSNNQVVYTAGAGGQYLTGMFGGLRDYDVNRTSSNQGITDAILADGGWLKIYQNSADLNPTAGTAGRTGQYAYTGVTGGTLMLDAVFSAGVIAGDTRTTYTNSFNEFGIVGGGGGYLDVTMASASWNAQFNTNSFTDMNGTKHDFLLSSDFAAFDPDDQVADWTVLSSGGVRARALPEPTSVALLGLGLAGLAGLRRRKQK